MRIFKFGGASIKDAVGVRNLVDVLNKVGHENTLVVVSAMGKTTNALEHVIYNYFQNKKEFKNNNINLNNPMIRPGSSLSKAKQNP
jgi:aspartate kinase